MTVPTSGRCRSPLGWVPALGGAHDREVLADVHEGRQALEAEGLHRPPVGVDQGEELVGPRAEEALGVGARRR